jgi:predicted nucleic acid-binding protein
VNEAVIYHLTEEVIDKTIQIRRLKRMKLPDAIIAATALVHGLILLSKNTKDFIGIPDLICVDHT